MIHSYYIDIHTHKKSGQELAIINLFPDDQPDIVKGNFYSVGLHPWYIHPGDYFHKLEIVRIFSRKDCCIAIGETGLDMLSKVDFNLQKSIFEYHVSLAEEVGKPLIIHCVRAFNELIQIKKRMGKTVPWIVHGYNSNLDVAMKLIEEGMMLSFGKALMKVNSNARGVLVKLPGNVFFLETDDSQFSIAEIYTFAAEARHNSIDHLKILIDFNFKLAFSLPNE